MSFLYPLFLLGGLAVAVPIVLHLLRRDVVPEVRFSAVRLLKRSPVERSRRRRLRDLVLLAARVAALLLLAAAFARPFVTGGAASELPLRIVAVDTSYSMGAPGAFEQARELAGAAIDEARFGEQVALVAFDDRATVITPPGSAADARAHLAGVRPGQGATRYAALLDAAATLAAGAAARLIVVSDLQRAGWDGHGRGRLPASVQVETRAVAPPGSNLAVTDARTGPEGLAAVVRNASAETRSGELTVSAEGTAPARATFTVAPHASTDVTVPGVAHAGAFTVSVADAAGYPDDNSRYVVGQATPSSTVLVVASPDSPGLFLERALQAADDGSRAPLRPSMVGPSAIAGGRAGTVGRSRAVVLLTTRGLDRAARDAMAAFVRGGGGLLIAAAPDVEPSEVAALFGWPAGSFQPVERTAWLTATDLRHPILRPLGSFAANLGQVRFTGAWRIDAPGWHVVARFDDGSPALLERGEGQGRVVLFASDVDRRWNEFPLHPMFVPFVAEAVSHVATTAPVEGTFMVGQTPADVPAAPGLHRLESGRVVSVNVDPRESVPDAVTGEAFDGMIERTAAAPAAGAGRAEQVEHRQNLWQYGLLLMVVVLATESLVGRA